MKEQTETTWADVAVALLSGAAMLIDFCLLVVASYVTTAVRPAFANIFYDFDAELPSATEAFLAVPSWLFLAAFATLAVVLIVKEIVLRRLALLSLCLNVVVGLGLLAAGVVAYLVLSLPLWSLYENLSA